MRRRISSGFFMRSNRRTAALIALILAAGSPRPAAACSGGDECYEVQCGSFFAPEIIENPAEAPFFLAPSRPFYDQSGDIAEEYRVALQQTNAREWSAFFQDKVPAEDLSYLLYTMSLPELDGLIFALKGKSAPLAPRAKALAEELARFADKGEAIKALYYLGVAKRVEPIATFREGIDPWRSPDKTAPPPALAAGAAPLIAGAEGLMKSAGDPFLRRRYRFQILRLLFYSAQYADCAREYAAHRDEFEAGGSLKYRAMDLAAGALYREKQYAEADYLYSLIFDQFPPLKKSAYRSFHPQEQSDWLKTLALAHGAREKAVLWQMLGIADDGVTAIEQIRSLEPRSKLLPLLLVREVNKAEQAYAFGPDSSSSARTADPRQKVSPALLAVVRRVADAGDADRPYLWELALAHLDALNGDDAAAEAALEKAAAEIRGDAVLEGQARMTRLFARVRAETAPDKAAEDYLARELSWLSKPINSRAGRLFQWALDRLGAVYAAGSDATRGLMLADQPSSPIYRDDAKVDALLAFARNPRKSSFDRFVAEHYGYDADQLTELEAINALYAGGFQRASALFDRIAKSPANAALRADPFLSRVVDCHDCDFADPQKRTYTKASFARRLLELKTRADGAGEDAARASFELAAGLYNMSYFGNARDVYETAHGNFSPELPRNRNMDLAEKYYRRALELSSDREFQARAAYMAEKCAHNRLYAAAGAAQPGGLDDYFSRHAEPGGDYFRLLKKSYSDTKYYAEILRECGYFRRFVEDGTP